MADGTNQPLGITTEPAGPPISGERPQAYRPVSLLAILSFVAAVAFAALIVADGTVAFAVRTVWVLAILTVLTPLASALGAAMAGIRERARLWRIAGLSLLVLYAGPVALGGLVAFPGRVPWLFPGWILIVPLVAGGLCWIARNRIQSSEGTLGGLALTTWGLWLSFYFGLIYAVYFAGTRLAVEQQAATFVEEYLNDLKQGEIEKAFLLTIEPARRPSGDDPAALRNELEMRFNVPGPDGEGDLARFSRLEHVRLLGKEGAQATIEQQGFSWVRQANGYVAEFRYEVTTPKASLTLLVSAIGEESPEGGRVWYIGKGTLLEGIRFTPSGEQFMKSVNAARVYLQSWQEKVREQKWNEAYLATLPPAKRKKYQFALAKMPLEDLAVTGLGPLATVEPEERQVLEDRARFFAGGLFAGADQPSFWTPPGKRPEIESALGRFFMPVGRGAPNINRGRGHIPTWGGEGKNFWFGFDISLTIPDQEKHGPAFQVQGRVIIRAEAPPDGYPEDGWWIERIELVRAQSPATPEMAGGPGM
jgi:hypothetical protein